MAGGYKHDHTSMRESVGDVPRMATIGDNNTDWDIGTRAPAQIKHGPGGRAAHGGGINLRAVADVLASYGMDPADEIAKILQATEPVLDARGNPVLDQDGKPLMKPVVALDVRLKAHTELLQYTRPKLKAVEVTMKEQELTDEQIEKRLKALMKSDEQK